MRRLISGLVAVVLALPGSARSQALPSADLIGTWVRRSDGGLVFDSLKGRLVATYLTINANGTYAYDGKIQQTNGQWRPYGIGWGKGTWALAADTLRFNDYRNISVAYKVVRKEGRLLLWGWPMWDANRRVEQCAEKEFERFDPSTALTLPLSPQVTIPYADLIGTWAGAYANKRVGPVSDTLIFDANHKLRSVHIGWNPYSESDSNSRWSGGDDWMLRPGDELTGMGLLGNYRIALHDDEIIPCNPVLAILKRQAAIQPADIAGTWVYRDVGEIHESGQGVSFDTLKGGQFRATYLTLDPGGAYVREQKLKQSTGEWSTLWKDKGTWALAADTLRVFGDSYKLVLKDGRLFLWRWDAWMGGRRNEICAEQAFERFDASKPLTAPPVPPITIDPADLVGTWGGKVALGGDWKFVTDTLVVGPDYSALSVVVGPADAVSTHKKGTWALLPGNVYAGPIDNIRWMKIYLDNGELVPCVYEEAILKRAAP